MRSRLEIYRAIADVTGGDLYHVRQHLASIKQVLTGLLAQLPEVPPILASLDKALREGSHGELALAVMRIHVLLFGK